MEAISSSSNPPGEESHQHPGFFTRQTYFVDGRNYQQVTSFYKAGGILFYRFDPEREGQLQVLMGLEKRSKVKGLEATPFFLHPIGGRIDREKDTRGMIDTAVREFYEETGELLNKDAIYTAVAPPKYGSDAYSDPHAAKNLYFGEGKYVLYLAPYKTNGEFSEEGMLGLDPKIDERFNLSRSSIGENGNRGCTEELSAIVWIDWEVIEFLLTQCPSLYLDNNNPGAPTPTKRLPVIPRDCQHIVLEDEGMRSSLLRNHLHGDYYKLHQDRDIVMSTFAVGLLGNACILEEIRRRKDIPFA